MRYAGPGVRGVRGFLPVVNALDGAVGSHDAGRRSALPRLR